MRKKDLKSYCSIGAIIIISILILTNALFYLVGITNSKILFSLFIFSDYFLILFALLCLGYLVYVYIKGEKERDEELGIIIFLGVIILLSIIFHQPWWKAQSEGLRIRMNLLNIKKDLPEIREWFNKFNFEVDTYSKLPYPDSWPTPIKRLKPNLVVVNIGKDPENSVKRLNIVLGGGGFVPGWGIRIGPENIEIPESTNELYILPLAPGAYVFHGIE